MFQTTRSYAMILIAACSAATTLSAQSADTLSSAPADSAVAALRPAAPAPAGPRLDATATAMRQLTEPTMTPMAQRAQPMSMGKPMALMIVGGAAIVLGAVIGDDVGTLFMIGGSAAVLWGLYQHLK